MCGISGIVDFKQPVSETVLKAMSDTMAHRGPDAQGLFVKDSIGLAHNRLAIIDLTGGVQPMMDESSGITIIFNGEIYNHLAIRKKLIKEGIAFETTSDTETLLKAWIQWGVESINLLNGMFAFSVWEPKKEKITLVRDRLGIKPLYYMRIKEGSLVYASELKALKAHPLFENKLNSFAIEDYLSSGYVPDHRSIYQNVEKLPPGCFAEFGSDLKFSVKQYWSVSFSNTYKGSFEDAVTEFDQRYCHSVQQQLISDVSLGAFLSGGVDSSSILAVMSEVLENPVLACSIGFDDKKFDEMEYAKAVADKYKAIHEIHQENLDGGDLIKETVDVFDEPFADASSIPTLRLCASMRQHCTVALSGDGGDEALAGYGWYKSYVSAAKLKSSAGFNMISPLFRLSVLERFAVASGLSVRQKLNRLHSLGGDYVEAFLHFSRISTVALRNNLYSDSFKASLDGYQSWMGTKSLVDEKDYCDDLSYAQALDFKNYLPADILTKSDRASMAHSLEVRVPFLDHELIDWCATLPAEFKINGQHGKYILKRAMETRLSNDVLYRPKQGFATPMQEWLLTRFRKDLERMMEFSHLSEYNIFSQKDLSKFIQHELKVGVTQERFLWSLIVIDEFLSRD